MSNNESSKSPTRLKLADKTTKGKGGLETRVYLSDTEEKGGSVKITEVEHDGQVVARKVEKDGKVVESSATPDVQHTDAVNGDIVDTAVGPAVSQMRKDEVKSDELEKARDPSKPDGLKSKGANKHCAVVKFLEFRSKLRELSNKNKGLPVNSSYSSYRESKIQEALARQAAKGSPYAEQRRSAGVVSEQISLSRGGDGMNSSKPKDEQKKNPVLRLVKSQGIANTLRLLSLVRKHLSSEKKDYDPAAAMASPEGLKIKALLTSKARNDKLAKDNKPHAAGSPEDSAHDVVEEGSSLKEELKALGTPAKMRKMLEHLRTLKDASALRSEQNRAVGLAKTDLNTVWNPFYRGPAQTPPPTPPPPSPPPRERSGMDMITSINTAGARARGLIKSSGDAEDVMAKAAPEGVSESKYERCKEKVAEKQGGSKTSPYNVYAVCRASLKKSVDVLRKAKVDEYLYGDRPKIKRIVREERRVAPPDPLAAKSPGTNLPKGPKAPEAPELKKANDGSGLPKGLLAVDSDSGMRGSEAHYWFDSEENARAYADGLYKHPDRTAHVHASPEQIRVGDKTHTAWRVRVRSWSLD